jgi:hypothetical protein
VGGGDEIDIVAALSLQGNHQCGKVPGRGCRSLVKMADVEVLAEHTPKIAVCKKDRTRAVPSHQGRLFTEVGVGTGNNRVRTGLADAPLSFQSIDAALPWAYRAGAQHFGKPGNSIL